MRPCDPLQSFLDPLGLEADLPGSLGSDGGRLQAWRGTLLSGAPIVQTGPTSGPVG